MSLTEHREMALRLVESAKAAILTTIDKNGFPQTRAMLNLRNKELWPKLVPLFKKHDDDFLLYFTSNTSSTKISDIKNNPAVSVYYYNPDEWRGVMFSGKMEIIEKAESKKIIWHDDWVKYGVSGYDDPDNAVLKLRPSFGRGWNQSTTYRFEIGDADETRE